MKNLTELVFILDRSGSMSGKEEDTIGGFNNLLEKQKQAQPLIGKYFIDSILAHDYNVIMALNMMYAILTVLGNLLMDIGYSLVDPRVRLE